MRVIVFCVPVGNRCDCVFLYTVRGFDGVVCCAVRVFFVPKLHFFEYGGRLLCLIGCFHAPYRAFVVFSVLKSHFFAYGGIC